MTVRCQIVRSERGYEGVIVNESLVTVYNTGFCSCAEDAESELENVILRSGWEAVPWNS